MSVDRQPVHATWDGATCRSDLPTCAEAVASALGSVRVEGLEPDAAGLALLDAVAAGELSTDEAIARAVALYAA